MNRSVLGVLIGIPTLATVSVGGTYLGTGETWESSVLRRGNKIKYGDNDEWTFGAAEVHTDWKEFFECCCKKTGGTCDSSCTDCTQGNCNQDCCEWKVKQDKKEAIKEKCSKLGRKVDWAWNRTKEDDEYTKYAQFCFKEKTSGGTSN